MLASLICMAIPVRVDSTSRPPPRHGPVYRNLPRYPESPVVLRRPIASMRHRKSETDCQLSGCVRSLVNFVQS